MGLVLVVVVDCCKEVVRCTGLVVVGLDMDRTGKSIVVECCWGRVLNAVGSWDQLVGSCLKYAVDIPWDTQHVEHRHRPGTNLGQA